MKLSPLIVALDLPDIPSIEKILEPLGEKVDFYKVGLRLFAHYGPEILRFLQQKNKKIFLDLKLHDIPNTVAETCAEIVRHQVQLFTLHASGGQEMLQAAVRAAQEEASRRGVPVPMALAVTVLTSMGDLQEIGINSKISDQVLRLVELSVKSGVKGIVCSPHEIQLIRQRFGDELCIVTPGIRPADASTTDDQKRVMTPAEAFRAGANSIVVGRPILKAEKPQEVVEKILNAAI